MARTWVVNSSPIIVLARISRLDLLLEAGAEIIIPSGVKEEIVRSSPEDPARRWIESGGKELVFPCGDLDPRVAAWSLGKGESHVLSCALRRPDSEVILDDRAARRCAKALGIACRGTLALLPLAKIEGRLSKSRPIIEAMEKAGFRIHPDVKERILRMTGEI